MILIQFPIDAKLEECQSMPWHKEKIINPYQKNLKLANQIK